MIAIAIEPAELLAQIAGESPTWLERARLARAANERDRGFFESRPNWSEVKRVYMRLQHGKCAYCERQLTPDPQDPTANYDLDLEHFRPKSSVAAWPSGKLKRERGLAYDIELGSKSARGYYLLSHEPLNYLAACKPCNSGFKSNYFPVAARRRIKAESPAAWTSEWAYLIYPVPGVDVDPQTLIGFDAVVPVPVEADDELHDHWRARVTIDFFDLARERLMLERCRQIALAYLALLQLDASSTGSELESLAQLAIEKLTSADEAHTSCTQAFVELHAVDPEAAKKLGTLAHAVWTRDVASQAV